MPQPNWRALAKITGNVGFTAKWAAQYRQDVMAEWRLMADDTMGPVTRRERVKQAKLCEACRGRFGHSLEGCYSELMGWDHYPPPT